MTESVDRESSGTGEAGTAAAQPDAQKSVENGGAEPAAEPEAALAEALDRAEQNHEQYLRAAAELDNLRKRAARDVENARKYGIERLAGELLAVIDSLEMGIEAGPAASAEVLLEGKTATLKLLLSALEKYGVGVVNPEGEPFDPRYHEAMTMQASESAEPGSVLEVIQKGYELNGRLLRPARVIVAADTPPDAAHSEDSAPG